MVTRYRTQDTGGRSLIVRRLMILAWFFCISSVLLL